MKYDIGILTFWNVPNYGTFAQAYALQKVIEKITSDREVVQIAHLDEKHFDFYYHQKKYLKSFPFWKKIFWKGVFEKKDTRIEKVNNNFLNSYQEIPHTEVITKDNLQDYQFDIVFLGSDIVWDYSMEPFNKDPLLFGLGMHGIINSYAASFGTICKDMIVPEYVKTGIKAMRHISVRDEKSAEIVEMICGEKPEVVLDPVWLWDFETDENVIIPKYTDYILVYGQDFTQEFIENLISYAKEEHLQLIALDCHRDCYDWCDILISQEVLKPLEWIGFFKMATAVATSTFHGFTFGLLFHKKIAFCKTDFILSKITDLLVDLKIMGLFDQKNDVKGMLCSTWDFEYIDSVIEQKRKKSLDFLKDACVNE